MEDQIMEIINYDELIKTVSEQIAKKFFTDEQNISQRALLIDAYLSEITSQIGLETTKIIYQKTLDHHLEKKPCRS